MVSNNFVLAGAAKWLSMTPLDHKGPSWMRGTCYQNQHSKALLTSFFVAFKPRGCYLLDPFLSISVSGQFRVAEVLNRGCTRASDRCLSIFLVVP